MSLHAFIPTTPGAGSERLAFVPWLEPLRPLGRPRLRWWRTGVVAAWLGLSALCSITLEGANLPADFVETDITGYWPEIAGVTFDSSGVMYAWERSGKVWIVENDVKLPTPLIDISEEVGAYEDYGLLGFALDPGFRQNGYLYLLYVVDHHHLAHFGTAGYDPAANEYNRATIGRITRYTARASDNYRSVDPASRKILLGETASTGFPLLFFTHGVGSLIFGTDGTLLASCGDGAGLSDSGGDDTSYYAQGLSEGIIQPKENIGAFRAQMVDSLSGKVLRLDPETGDGVPGNPFYDSARPRSARSRVWALGLRNPFRMALQPGTGSLAPAEARPGVLVVTDVGYDTWEEVSVITGPGMNFGWPIFEGFGAGYDADIDPPNLDAPNPLFGAGGCAKQYFSFRDLLKEAAQTAPSWPNPCDAANPIPATIPRFVHARPAIDWRHDSGSGPSRAGSFSNNAAIALNLGAPGSPIAGPQFGGNCSIGGVFYQGTNFPAQYRNRYFFADLDYGWIRTMTFAGSNAVSVGNFASGAASVVSMAVHPISGALYYVLFYDGVRKITFTGAADQPPTAVATASAYSGRTPLTVQFNGSGSTDPENQPLSYAWNFGDGTPPGTGSNVTHTFNAPAGVPTRFTVTLTVTDVAQQTATTNLTISVNNSPNNDFADAQGIHGASGSVTGSNLDANKEPLERNHAGNAGGHSVWYRWHANCGGTLRIDPAGSGFPVLLAVYRGSSLSTLSTIAAAVNQAVQFSLIPGSVYQIAVDGHNGATGDFTLQWQQTLLAGGGPDLVIVTNSIQPEVITMSFAPDNCDVLDGCTMEGTRQLLRFAVETLNQGNEDLVIGSRLGSPLFEYDSCNDYYQFRYYASFRLLDNGGQEVATGNKFGFCLLDSQRVLPNASTTERFTCNYQGLQAGWSDVYSAGLPCQYLDVTTVPAGQYALEVHLNSLNRLVESNPSNNVAVLPVVVEGSCTGPPPNDIFVNAALLSGEALSIVGDTRCATKQTGEPSHAGNAGGRSIWYRWTAPYSGSTIISLMGSSFDTLLAVYSGSSLGGISATLVAQNDDYVGGAQSQVSFNATAGATYRIAVDGYNSGGGAESGKPMLHINPARNDAFTNALAIAGTNGSVLGYTRTATREAGEPNHAGNPGGHSVWFRWVAPRSGVAVFDTADSRFDTVLAIYSGTMLDSLSLLGGNSSPPGRGRSRVELNVTAGASYAVALDGLDGASGLFRLNWSMAGVLSVVRLPDGNIEITADGQPGEYCTLQVSSNLVHWAPVATVLNQTGRVQFSPQPASSSARFYRMVATPASP
jgi:glucose/arabinose dehydrogenase